MRQYDDPVEVRRGWRRGTGEGPEQFLWRGRLWKVRAVLAHWVETGPWWQTAGVRAVIGSDDRPRPDGAVDGRPGRPPRRELLVERELWRVEAGRGPRPTASRTTAGSSTSPSTGPTGAGSSSAASTEEAADDQPGPTSPRPARHHPLLPRPRRDVAAARRSPRATCRPATPAPTSRRCGPRPPCSRPGPGRPRARGRQQSNAWVLLAEVAPELEEWARFFAAGAAKRAAAEAGLDPGRHRAGGRRPGPRRRPVPRRGRAGARPGPAPRCRRPSSATTAPGRGPVSPDPFVHLHVASGYSLQYGASHPHALVERAAEQEMDTLALTDRDGTYGAVKFARACPPPASGRCSASTSPTSPPLAPATGARAAPAPRPRTPVRGGGFRDPPATGAGCPGSPCWPRRRRRGPAGWAAICRMVSAVHLAGRARPPGGDPRPARPPPRGRRRAGAARPGLRAGGGRDPAPRRPGAGRARAVARGGPAPTTCSSSWSPTGSRAATAPGVRAPPPTPPGWPASPAAPGWSAVLTNAVRYADRLDAPTVDVLDAARRLVALDRRHVDRGQRRGVPQVRQADARGRRGDLPARRPRATRRGRRGGCWPAPARSPTGAPSTRAADLGLGEVHFPELGHRRRPRLHGRGRRGCSARAARRRSAGATARRPGSGSGSGSTTSSR